MPTEVLARSAALQTIVDALRARQEELVDDGVRRIRSEIPGYAAIADPVFIADVRTHVSQEHDALIRSIELGRPLTAMEIDFVRPRAMRRVGRLPLPDFMQAFRIYTEVFWEAVLASVVDDATRREALALPSIVMRYMNIAASEAAEVYVEADRLLPAQGERGRRDLLEDLLAGRSPEPGPKLAAARHAGLAPTCSCVLVVAAATAPLPDDHHLRACATWLSRAFGGIDQALAVVRHHEVVIVAPIGRERIDAVVAELTAVQAQLADERVTLAIGVSTVHDSLRSLPEAYLEAVSAAERIRATGGVLALTDLSAFDCLTLFGQDTARRRIPEGYARSSPTTWPRATCSRRRCWSTSPRTSTPSSPPSGSTCTRTRRATASRRSRNAPGRGCAAWPTCWTCSSRSASPSPRLARRHPRRPRPPSRRGRRADAAPLPRLSPSHNGGRRTSGPAADGALRDRV